MESLAAVFLTLSGPLLAGVWYWIFAPMYRATYNTKRSPQFFVSDFFCLLAQLQVVLAVVIACPLDSRSGSSVLLGGVLGPVAVIATWWASITALSRASVRSPLKRAAFVLIVVPVVMLGVGGVFILNVFNVYNALQWYWGRADTNLLWLWVLYVPAAALFFCCRRLTFWIVAGSETPPG